MEKKLIFIITILLSLQNTYGYAYENSIYIWQRKWDPQIEDSIKALQPQIKHFVILSGEARLEQKNLSLSSISINWPYLKNGSKVTLAFRVNTQISNLLQTDNACQGLAKKIKQVINSQILAAAKGRIVVTGIQFDYDCPTSKLADYARFVKYCHKEFPSFEISVTVLPTWLNSKDFKQLISPTAFYVLQLHSFELPRDFNQAKNIFLKDKATLYLNQADQYRHPYYISLPTYGYEVAFSDNGKKFIGLRAENASILWGKNIRYETVMVNPDTILSFTSRLEQEHPRSLLGICWFRLPVKYDEFNWDIKTLKAILAGRTPALKLKTEKVSSQNGLHEVYLLNTGERNIIAQLNFKVTWADTAHPLYDILGQYQGNITDGGCGILIKGPVPRVGERVLVGWFRNIDKTRDMKLNIGGVTVNENN